MAFIFISAHSLKDAAPHCYRDKFIPRILTVDAFFNSVWAPAIYKGGFRLEKQWLSCSIAALDFDNGMTIEQALEIFREYEHIIATTKSHGIKGDRFRVVLFFEHTISNLELYKHNMRLLTDKFGADKACKDGARFFYPCKDLVSSMGGVSLPVVPLPVASKPVKRTRTNSFLSLLDVRPAPEGSRNRCTFAAACKFFRAGLSEDAIYERVSVISNGLPREEISKILASARLASGKN
jgi:hypothetical protein